MSQSLSRIVVATDFSAASELAVQRAAQLALHHQAQLILVHAIAAAGWIDDVIGVAPPLAADRLHAALQTQLQAQLDALPVAQRPRSEWLILDGSLHRALPQWLSEHPADLLVLGACSSSAWRHILLGSTAKRLLRQSPLPLLLVRTPPDLDYQNVLLSTDFSATSERAADFGVHLSKPAKYFLFHADERLHEPHLAFIGLHTDVVEAFRRERTVAAMQKLEAMSQRWSDCGSSVMPILRDAPTSRVLTELVDDIGADLVVLGASGHGQLTREFLGSVSQHAASTLPCDVLVVP